MKVIKKKKEEKGRIKNLSSSNSSKSINESIINDLDEELKPFVKVISISRSSKTYQKFE